jgi:hypothetical protein
LQELNGLLQLRCEANLRAKSIIERDSHDGI